MMSTGCAELPEIGVCSRSSSINCAKLKALGYITGKRLNLYGEHFQIVSDPFAEGDAVSVRVVSGDDPTVRTIRLPAALLVGFSDLIRPPHAVAA